MTPSVYPDRGGWWTADRHGCVLPRPCLLLSAAHISSATRAPMTGVPVVSPTPATMDRAKMVFIISFCGLARAAAAGGCGAARNARPRALAGLQYSTLMIHSYIVRDYSFFSPFFFSKRSKFRLSHQLF